jgi:hypothetical protein
LNEKYILNLTVACDDLVIRINAIVIGYINGSSKRLTIVNSPIDVKLRSKWVNNGCKCDNAVINHHGGTYTIYKNSLLRKDIRHGYIYDFYDNVAEINCADPNVLKYEYNQQPIVF